MQFQNTTRTIPLQDGTRRVFPTDDISIPLNVTFDKSLVPNRPYVVYVETEGAGEGATSELFNLTLSKFCCRTMKELSSYLIV